MSFTIPHLFDKTTKRIPNKTFIVDGDKKYSFIEASFYVNNFLIEFSKMNFCPGDRIGIYMEKSAAQVLAIIAIMHSNAVFVPILPNLKKQNISHIIEDSGMKYIFSEKKRISEINDLDLDIDVIDIPNIFSKMKEPIHEKTNKLDSTFRPLNTFNRICSDISAIIYSSGSTGMPKGIMITHRNLTDGAKIVAKYLGTVQNDRIACVLSFNFDYGLNQIWQAIYTGASIYLHNLILPNDLLNFLSKNKITALPLMPVIISRITNPNFISFDNNFSFKHLRYISSSGGRISIEMVQLLKKIFKNHKFYSMYGLTEAFRSTYLNPNDLDRKFNTIGKAIPNVEILVLDENGNESPVGVNGELVHRGGCIAKGYWNDDIKTKLRFRKHPKYPGETLVYSGDIVFKDEEGFITFVGRNDLMLKSHGIRISPTEIETIAEKFYLIESAVVFGIDNIHTGQDIILAYTRKNQSVSFSKNDFLIFLRKNLPQHMIPKNLVEYTKFPVTGNEGKFDIVAIKDSYIANQDK